MLGLVVGNPYGLTNYSSAFLQHAVSVQMAFSTENIFYHPPKGAVAWVLIAGRDKTGRGAGVPSLWVSVFCHHDEVFLPAVSRSCLSSRGESRHHFPHANN